MSMELPTGFNQDDPFGNISNEPIMSILKLSEMTGVGVHTIRVWEKRYDFLIPFRLKSGHRRYSLRQVEELKYIVRGKNLGFSLGSMSKMGFQRLRTVVDDMVKIRE